MDPNNKCVTLGENTSTSVPAALESLPKEEQALGWGPHFLFHGNLATKKFYGIFKPFLLSLFPLFFHSNVTSSFNIHNQLQTFQTHLSAFKVFSSNLYTTAWSTYCKFLIPITKTKKGGEFLLILVLTSVILSVNTLRGTAAVSDRHVAVSQAENKLLCNPKEFPGYVHFTTASDSFLLDFHPSPALPFKGKKSLL